MNTIGVKAGEVKHMTIVKVCIQVIHWNLHIKVSMRNCSLRNKIHFDIRIRRGRCSKYSLVRLVRPNTEELISRPFMCLLKIRWLHQDLFQKKSRKK